MLILFLFISLPVTVVYISPVIILMGASEGIASGSMILFILTFIASLVLGRFWCGWFCPLGGFQELCVGIQNKPVTGGRLNLIKYGVWVVWIVALFALFFKAGGIHTIDIFYNTDSGVSITEPAGYIVLYVILCIIFLFAIIAGKRGFCHYLCPVCVNFIIGRKIQSFFKWPALHLTGDKTLCIDCRKCTKACPMGLDVRNMVVENKMENPDCILCASCSDICPNYAISYGLR